MINQQIESRILKTGTVKWRQLLFIQKDDFKEWLTGGQDKLTNSLIKYQFIDPFKVWEAEDGVYCLDGRHRFLDLEKAVKDGIAVPDELPAVYIDCKDKKEAAELTLVFSSSYAKITEKGLAGFIEQYNLNIEDFTGISLPNIPDLQVELLMTPGDGLPSGELAHIKLQDKFIIPPFSIFDTRQGYWQERKQQWHSIGFNSQATREDIELVAKSGQSSGIYEMRNALRQTLGRDPEWDEIIEYAKSKGKHIYEGASIFDPVLCEIIYTWFCKPGTVILDPTAGGSVRGIVAAMLGHEYHGVDLRADQVAENERQAQQLKLSSCKWYQGDSSRLNQYLPETVKAGLIFTCPPYYDLEKYSDDPADMSNMTYPQFLLAYKNMIVQSVERLEDDCFACFVVSDIRDENGFYRGFANSTVQFFEEAGCKLYNEIVLINVAGSLPVRVGRQFQGYRKVGRMHQEVLIFYKGDPKNIKEKYPEIQVKEMSAEVLEE